MSDQIPSTPTPAEGTPQEPAASGAWGPLIDSGSKVVVVVSQGTSPTPQGAQIIVPSILGLTQGDALAKMQQAGFAVQAFHDHSSTVAKGKVIGQLPDAGLGTPADTRIVMMVSDGPAATVAPQVALPEVVGLAESEALAKLQSGGLSTNVVRAYSPQVAEGVVVSQLPSARSLAADPPKRSLVWLWVLLGVLAALILGGLWFFSQSQPPATEESVVATDTVDATAPSVAVVPNVVGMSQDEAESALTGAGFAPIATKVTTNDMPAGQVVAQIPAANTQLTPGSQVAIQVAQASEPPKPTTVAVPNVVGMTQANAQSALLGAGLAPSFVNQASDAPKGQAFEQQPSGGASVAPESVVIVAISTGQAPAPPATTVAVPAVIGKAQADAEKALTDATLASQVVQTYSATVAKGIVIQQWPPAGNKVAPGTPVALVVSLGQKPTGGEMVTVPNVKGMTAAAATQALADVGLVAQKVSIADPNTPEGQVVGQLPAAASTVPPGSAVLIGVAEPGTS